MKYLALFATLVISMGIVACKKAAPPASTAPAVVVTIFPTATQTVLPGKTITFTETVTNTANTAVTWEVNGNVGGDTLDGTISTTGVYTAPTSVINPFDVQVTVVSAADSTKSASTTVAVSLPPPVIISPTSATVAAGATQQFTPTTTPANLPVNWAVNGVTGGNSVVGTVTQSGLYTAPQVPFAGGPVTVSAALQSDSTKFAVATATLTYSNFSLQKSYAFSLRGSDRSGLLLRAGSMTADGNGNITAGIEDINNGINLVQPGVSFTGTYSIGADGRGSVTFNDGFNGNTPGAGNASKFSVVIVSAGQVQMEELDTFAAASGEADLQDATSFNTAAFSGEYVFDFSGVDAASKPLSAVGELFADGLGGGMAEAAQEDVNDNGTLTSGTPTFSFQSVGANGRGLATLNGASYSFYMVSAARAQFIAIGNPASAVTAGAATLQASGGFSSTSLGGSSVLITNGNSTTGPISAVATFFLQANPNQISNGVLNQNNTGSFSSANFTGTYTVASNGRGTAAFLPTGQTYVFYLIGVNQAVIQETDSSAVADGTLQGLAGGPFSTSSLAGGYAVQMTGVKSGVGEQDALGQVNLTSGQIGQVATGTVDVNTANGPGGLTAFTPASGVAIPSGTTYTISNGQGPFNVTVAGTSLTFTAYFLSSSSLYLLRTDMTDTRVLHGGLFQDVSLSPAIVSAASATFTVGTAGTFTVITAGNPAPTLTETGALPSGVTFDAQTGVLSGTPATGTGGATNMSYPIQFTASNGVGSNAVQNFTLTVVYCVPEGNGTCTPN
jgi:putative Ig domain-containing protein